MSDTNDLEPILDSVVESTTETIANLIGLACAQDTGNRLRLLALLRDATSRALTHAFDEATEAGYTVTEIEALLTQPEEWK